jgi:ADP-ribosylation factor related protein 1
LVAVARFDVGSFRLLVWDVGGHSDFRTVWHKYFSEAHGVVFVVDSADGDRLSEAKAALGQHLAASSAT